MIQMHADCLTFNMPDGESIPCSAELVTIEPAMRSKVS